MSMSKTDLIEVIANENKDMTKAAAKRTLEALLNAVSNEVKNGEKVAITGFGTFELKTRAARTGRNPQTGEVVEIPASKSVGFKVGKGLKDFVNEK